jgi:hypothetical protein
MESRPDMIEILNLQVEKEFLRFEEKSNRRRVI